jgi:hypothetical protein
MLSSQELPIPLRNAAAFATGHVWVDFSLSNPRSWSCNGGFIDAKATARQVRLDRRLPSRGSRASGGLQFFRRQFFIGAGTDAVERFPDADTLGKGVGESDCVTLCGADGRG